jgi:hypothetical protein
LSLFPEFFTIRLYPSNDQENRYLKRRPSGRLFYFRAGESFLLKKPEPIIPVNEGRVAAAGGGEKKRDPFSSRFF